MPLRQYRFFHFYRVHGIKLTDVRNMNIMLTTFYSNIQTVITIPLKGIQTKFSDQLLIYTLTLMLIRITHVTASENVCSKF